MKYFHSNLHYLPRYFARYQCILAHEKKSSFQYTDSAVWSVLENNKKNIKDDLKIALSFTHPCL